MRRPISGAKCWETALSGFVYRAFCRELALLVVGLDLAEVRGDSR